MQKTAAKHRRKETESEKACRKRRLVAGSALLVTAGALGAAFAPSAFQQVTGHTDYTPSQRFTIVDGYQDYTIIEHDRIREEAWLAVWKAHPGEIAYMDARMPVLGKPLAFLDAMADGKKYAVTVQCEDSMGLACTVMGAPQEIEARDYHPFGQAAQEAANKVASKGSSIQRGIDPARLMAVFEDASTGNSIRVLCTNPLNYSCTARVAPKEPKFR